ncbi:hypothetical protein [Acidaminococcus timonensis]|uniref:hypothetical protein n=1 Tax=Acidaminococcus timonensis TaxID=1871002 RepID=UPI0008DA7A4F|nr:hypothetical protein [Acidaminococcus timonensis]
MKRQAYQHPELRDANDSIIQDGAFGKKTPLANAEGTGWIDYVANDLEALHDAINGGRVYVANKDALPATGDLSAMYIAEDTGKWYLWDGQKYIETDNARKIADEAIAARDAAKASANDAANSAREQQADWNVTDSTSKAFIKNKPQVIDEQGVTTIAQRITDAGLDDVRLYMANGITTKALTVYEESSVPTANAGNSSKAIANTEFVAKSISALVNGAPDQLNTLNELAKALGNDSNFAATMTAELAKKLNSTEAESTYATKQEAGVPYQIKRNTAYKVGDVLTSPSLPPGCVIVVTQAGTTGSTEPDWTTVKSNMGGVIADGTVTFYINDTLSKHSIGDIIYKPLTKTGEHEYLLPLDGQTIDGDKYKRLVDYLGTTTLPNLNGRYLRADATPGQMVEAGLPNITGKFQRIYTYADQAGAQGAFSLDAYATNNGPYENGDTNNALTISLNASRSSAIYGKSTTVTPLTYTVRAFICYA